MAGEVTGHSVDAQDPSSADPGFSPTAIAQHPENKPETSVAVYGVLWVSLGLFLIFVLKFLPKELECEGI